MEETGSSRVQVQIGVASSGGKITRGPTSSPSLAAGMAFRPEGGRLFRGGAVSKSENGRVVTFGNADDDRIRGTFQSVIVPQFCSQAPGLGTHNRVFLWIVVWSTTEDRHPNRRFLQVLRVTAQCRLNQKFEKLDKPFGAPERGTFPDSFETSPDFGGCRCARPSHITFDAVRALATLRNRGLPDEAPGIAYRTKRRRFLRPGHRSYS